MIRLRYLAGWMTFMLFSVALFAAEGAVEGGESGLLFSAFTAGLLLTFTPCVLPMVPILSSIIVGQGKDISRMKAFWLSVSYVLGTAVIYAVMGALAGATGEQLQAYFENVWAIGAVTFLFVLMALSMFGLFTIQLPSFIQSRLNAGSQRIKGGSLMMVFLLGMISALIIGACVSPILIAFLGIAMGKGDALSGAVTMFFMALGMGVPLVLVGVGMGTLLPRAGAWMERVKQIFGVLLLATAIYLFNTTELLPPLLVWGLFLIVLSVYMGATEPLEREAEGWRRLLKGVAVTILVWGMLLLVGAAYGEKDILRPLPEPIFSSYSPATGEKMAATAYKPFPVIGSREALQSKKEEAKAQRKMFLLFFSHDYCGSCKKYKATVFKDPTVRKLLQKEYVTAQINMTDKSDSKSQQIKKEFKVFGPPTFIFFDREGNEIEGNRIYGYQSPEEFVDMLEMMAS